MYITPSEQHDIKIEEEFKKAYVDLSLSKDNLFQNFDRHTKFRQNETKTQNIYLIRYRLDKMRPKLDGKIIDTSVGDLEDFVNKHKLVKTPEKTLKNKTSLEWVKSYDLDDTSFIHSSELRDTFAKLHQ